MPEMHKNGLLHWARHWSAPALLAGAVACAVGVHVAPLQADPPKVAKRTETADKKPDATAVPPSPTAVKTATGSAKHPLTPALEIARASKIELAKVKDYSATFTKRERIGKQLNQQTMQMKFRSEPMSVYMKFVNPNPGREVIYVANQNGGNMLVHETGIKAIVGTLALPLNHPEVMKENRHPMSQLGLANLIDLQITLWEKELKYGEVNVKISDVKLGDVACQMIETTHPQARQQFMYHKSRLYFDAQSKLPVRVENYGFPKTSKEQPPLIEEYTYANLRTNVGFTDFDFDRRNKQYGF